MTVPAIVLGNGTTAIGVIRCLSRRGIDVHTVTANDDLARHSRYFQPARCQLGRQISVDWRERDYSWLESLDVKRAVLFPCSDLTAAYLVDMPESLRKRYPTSIPSKNSLHQLLDKRQFARLCAELDVAHPTCYVMETDEDLVRVPIEGNINLFFKPANSRRFLAAYRCKAMHIRDRAHAQELWEQFHADGMDLLIQEYIPGPHSQHFFVDGFRDRNGNLRAKHSRQRLRAYPADFGNSSCCKQIENETIAVAWKTMEKILDHLDYRGIFSAEFKYDERDCKYKILEVNSRAWVYVEFAGWCGLDVCWLAYNDALKLSVPEVVSKRSHAECVDIYSDYQSIKSQFAVDRPRHREIARQWLTSRKPLFCWDDPLPAIRWFTKTLATRLS